MYARELGGLKRLERSAASKSNLAALADLLPLVAAVADRPLLPLVGCADFFRYGSLSEPLKSPAAQGVPKSISP